MASGFVFYSAAATACRLSLPAAVGRRHCRLQFAVQLGQLIHDVAVHEVDGLIDRLLLHERLVAGGDFDRAVLEALGADHDAHGHAEQVGVELDVVNRYLQSREVPQLLDGIQQAGARAAKIVTHMLSFSRRSNRQMAPCDLPALIDQAVEIAGNDFDLTIGFDFKGQAIVRQFDPQLGPVPGTANELEQVLLNLLKNAAQAIHLREDDREPGRIILRTRLNPPWAEIQVEDNGIGMSENVRKRTFEPFFTTKEIGQGTGLGLSVSYFIITNNHKGQMEVQSTPGLGTCFTLRLPLTASTVATPLLTSET